MSFGTDAQGQFLGVLGITDSLPVTSEVKRFSRPPWSLEFSLWEREL